MQPRGGYSTLSWVWMCGPKFRPPPYKKTREDANLLPISKPFVSWRALFKTNQCFLQYKLGCISTFWQPIDKTKDKFIRNYAFCKNATYIKTNFQIKKGPLQNLSARNGTLSGPHIPVPTFPLSTPPGMQHVTFYKYFIVIVIEDTMQNKIVNKAINLSTTTFQVSFRNYTTMITILTSKPPKQWQWIFSNQNQCHSIYMTAGKYIPELPLKPTLLQYTSQNFRKLHAVSYYIWLSLLSTWSYRRCCQLSINKAKKKKKWMTSFQEIIFAYYLYHLLR